MTQERVKEFQATSLELQRQATGELSNVQDTALGLMLPDGRTVRQALHDLIDQYQERNEELMWTKWGQAPRFRRSECKALLGDLQGSRARFFAYLTDFRDDQLDTQTEAAHDESASSITNRLIEEEEQLMTMISRVLEGGK